MSTPLAVAVFVGLPLLLFAVISLVVWAGCEVGAARRGSHLSHDQASRSEDAAGSSSAAWWGVADQTTAAQ